MLIVSGVYICHVLKLDMMSVTDNYYLLKKTLWYINNVFFMGILRDVLSMEQRISDGQGKHLCWKEAISALLRLKWRLPRKVKGATLPQKNLAQNCWIEIKDMNLALGEAEASHEQSWESILVLTYSRTRS